MAVQVLVAAGAISARALSKASANLMHVIFKTADIFQQLEVKRTPLLLTQLPSLQQLSAGQWFDALQTALPDPPGTASDSKIYRMQTGFV